MKKFIFLFLSLFLVIGALDVRSDSPPENKSYMDYTMPMVDVVSFELADYSLHRYSTIEGFIVNEIILIQPNRDGKPLNKARDKLSVTALV